MKVQTLAVKEKRILSKYAAKIEFAGSLRRKAGFPKDVDIVIVPKSDRAKRQLIEYAMKQKRGNIGRGEKLVAYKKQGVEFDIYFTDRKSYGAMLMFLTGPQKYNIWLRRLAKNKGMKLNQYGLFKGNRCIASKKEADIYQKLGKLFKSPELRGLSEKEAERKFGVLAGARILRMKKGQRVLKHKVKHKVKRDRYWNKFLRMNPEIAEQAKDIKYAEKHMPDVYQDYRTGKISTRQLQKVVKRGKKRSFV